MTNIPEVYLAEAMRRLNTRGLDGYSKFDHSSRILASTLQELGWTPPVDAVRMAKARKVAAAVLGTTFLNANAEAIQEHREQPNSYGELAIQAAYKALEED